MGTTSVPVSLSRILILLSRIPSYRIPSYLLLLLCNTEPTRTLSIVHPPTLRVALIHGTWRNSRISWLMLLMLVMLVMLLVMLAMLLLPLLQLQLMVMLAGLLLGLLVMLLMQLLPLVRG